MNTELYYRNMELNGMKGIFFSQATPTGFLGSHCTLTLRLKPEVMHGFSYRKKRQ
jgi:hypothetical protein